LEGDENCDPGVGRRQTHKDRSILPYPVVFRMIALRITLIHVNVVNSLRIAVVVSAAKRIDRAVGISDGTVQQVHNLIVEVVVPGAGLVRLC